MPQVGNSFSVRILGDTTKLGEYSPMPNGVLSFADASGISLYSMSPNRRVYNRELDATDMIFNSDSNVPVNWAVATYILSSELGTQSVCVQITNPAYTPE